MNISTKDFDIIVKALSNLEQFVALYGDDESEELLNYIKLNILKKDVPPLPVFIKMSFLSLSDGNVFNALVRTERLLHTDENGRKVVELKIQDKYASLSAESIEQLFKSAMDLSQESIDGDVDDKIMEAWNLKMKGAIFISAYTSQ